ncbi:MAG: integron integrase [Nitrospirota bacterium]
MAKSSDVNNNLLPEFQKFLAERKLAPEKNIPFLAYWVSRFFVFARRLERSVTEYDEIAVQEFIETLRSDKRVLEWQPKQASDALRLYYFNYLGKTGGQTAGAARIADRDSAFRETRRLIRLKHYSYSTERTYLQWIERFFSYALESDDKKIDDLSSADFKNFLSHLALKQRVSSSTQNQAFNAILFLFRYVLNKETEHLGDTVRAKRGQKLPVVLTVEEMGQLFRHMTGTNLLIAELLYGAGLRLMELARLRVQDIDLDANTIFIRSGKGDKDRTTMLPVAVKERLREHLKKVKALHDKDVAAGHGAVFLPDALERKYPDAAKEWRWQYVFPSSKLSVDPRGGKVGRHHISDKSIQLALRDALRQAGIVKHATVHTLRHSFATHLLQNGINIREVQSLLGHKNVETTMIYTHVLRNMANAPQSPLDVLYGESK